MNTSDNHNNGHDPWAINCDMSRTEAKHHANNLNELILFKLQTKVIYYDCMLK